jgi:hypothetical protein
VFSSDAWPDRRRITAEVARRCCRLVSATLSLTLLGVLCGCGATNSASGLSSVRRGVLRSDPTVGVVRLARTGAYRMFPAQEGSRQCVIHGGGPAPGMRIRGTCRTSVRFPRGHSGQAVVTFAELWPWQSFHAAYATGQTQRFSWRFVVLPTGRVLPAGRAGDPPPQFVP